MVSQGRRAGTSGSAEQPQPAERRERERRLAGAGRGRDGGFAARVLARCLPDAAAGITGNDAAPGARAAIAGKPSSAARPGGADGYVDRDIAAAADRTGDPASARRCHTVADDRERHAIAGAARAARGGEDDIPDAVISTSIGPGCPDPRIGGTGRNGQRNDDGDGGREPAQPAWTWRWEGLSE